MRELSKSEIFRLSHLQANILGRDKFPSILSKISKLKSNYKGKIPYLKYKTGIKEGTWDSTDLLCLLLNIGLSVEEIEKEGKPNQIIVPQLGHFLHGYKDNTVYLSESNAKWFNSKIERHYILSSGLAVDLPTIASIIASHGEGFTVMADNTLETSCGFTIQKFSKYKDLYFWNKDVLNTYERILEENKEKIYVEKDITEKDLQLDLINLWNLLKTSSPDLIDVDYEIGVKSGEKVVDLSESRYDLVVRFGKKVNLVELKKGSIDMSVIRYKVGIMEMGIKSDKIFPDYPDQKVLFVGSRVDPKAKKFLDTVGASKIILLSYKEYLSGITALSKKLDLGELEKDMVDTLIQKISNKFIVHD